MTPTTPARLMIASTDQADMLYVAGIQVPDPFVACQIDGRWHGLFSTLEYGRARRCSRFAGVELDVEWRKQAEERELKGVAAIAALWLEAHGISTVQVPGWLPLAEAEKLRALGLVLDRVDGPFFPQRAIKTANEIAELARAEKLTAASMRQAEHYLAACTVGPDAILRSPTTSQKVRASDLRMVIDSFLIGHGATPSHTIVACGRQSADPHETGHGYLHADQPIILDIFPRLQASGYWGDMTRTFVKGKASPELKAQYQAVKSAQKLGLSLVRHGMDGKELHEAVQECFNQHGFSSETKRGKPVGFIHGTGHGVGLEIHESPRISTSACTSDRLEAGMAVTVEPGLYYPQTGGVRLEDLVIVEADGCRNLTNYPCRLEIK